MYEIFVGVGVVEAFVEIAAEFVLGEDFLSVVGVENFFVGVGE